MKRKLKAGVKGSPKPMDYLLCIVLLIPFLEPRGISETLTYRGTLSVINSLFFYAQIAVLLLMSILVLLRRKCSAITIWIVVYYAYMFADCVLLGTDTSEAETYLISVMGFLLVLEFYIQRDISVFIRTFVWLVGGIVFLNAILVLLYPNGMYINTRGDTGNWLLGYYNAHFFTVLPWCILFLTTSTKKHGKLTWLAVLVVAALTACLYMAGSKTSTVSMVVFLLALTLSMKVGKIHLPNISIIVAISALLSYLMIAFHIQDYFADFILNVLHRDVSLTGRTMIWTMAMNSIRSSPIIGNGSRVYELNNGMWTTTQAHNTFLNILVNGGIVGFILFMLPLVLLAVKMRKMSGHIYKKIYLLSFIAYGVSFFAEMFQLPWMFAMLVFLAYHLEEIIEAMPMKNVRTIRIRLGSVSFKL